MKTILKACLYSLLLAVKANAVLQHEEVEFYNQNGYLVVEGFCSLDECDRLQKRMATLVEEFDPSGLKTIFTTDEQERHANRYFLESSDKIAFFFEKDAFDHDGELKFPKERCINKVAHALHELDPVFKSFSKQNKINELTEDLGIVDPIIMQSMYIFKQPKIGDAVTCHQDATFLYSEPQTCVGFWFALEDATLENGCLWVQPGGHNTPLKKRYIRDENGNCSFEVYDESEYEIGSMVPVEVKRGTLVIIHGLIPHMSFENSSDQSRHAYTMHLIDGRSHWSEKNWLQKSKENFASH